MKNVHPKVRPTTRNDRPREVRPDDKCLVCGGPLRADAEGVLAGHVGAHRAFRRSHAAGA